MEKVHEEILKERIWDNLTDKEKNDSLNYTDLIKKVYLIGLIDGTLLNKTNIKINTFLTH